MRNDLDPLRKRAIFVALLSYRLSRNYYRAADFITFLRRIELHNGSKIKFAFEFFYLRNFTRNVLWFYCIRHMLGWNIGFQIQLKKGFVSIVKLEK